MQRSFWIEHPIVVDVTEMAHRRFEKDLQYICWSTRDNARHRDNARCVLTDKTKFLHRGKAIDRKMAETLIFSKVYKVYAVSTHNDENHRNDPVHSTKRHYPALLVATFRHHDRTNILHALCSVYNRRGVPEAVARLTASLLQC